MRIVGLCLAVAALACGGASEQVRGSDATVQSVEPSVSPVHGTGKGSGTGAGTRMPTGAEQHVLAGLVDVTARIRGLSFRTPPVFYVQTARTIAQHLTDQVDEELIVEARDLYVGLGMIEAHVDVRALLLSLLEEQVVGYYDPKLKRMVVRDDVMRGLGRGEQDADAMSTRMTIVHELVHALQDQHYKLDRLEGVSRSDARTAFQCVVEGDAMLAMLAYAIVGSGLSLSDMLGRSDNLSSMVDGAFGSPVLNGAPAIVRESLIAPYLDGLTYVGARFQEGGWQAVNDSLVSPPVAMVTVLHGNVPEPRARATYRSPEDLLQSMAMAKGDPEREHVLRDTLGEFELGVFLKIDRQERRPLGWRWDEVDVFRRKGRPGATPPVAAPAGDEDVEILWRLGFVDGLHADRVAQRVRASRASRNGRVCVRGSNLVMSFNLSPETLRRVGDTLPCRPR